MKAKAFEPTLPSYALELHRKRDALERIDLPIADDEDVVLTKEAEDRRQRVIQAFKDAQFTSSNGRWAAVVQLLRLPCVQSCAPNRWLAPYKQPDQLSEPFHLQSWAEEVSELLRNEWEPRSGSEYEDDLLHRAQHDWKPDEEYPTRETAVIKQILEKREWAASVQELVNGWFESTTRDGSTELGVLVQKKKLVAGIGNLLKQLIPMDALDAARIKNIDRTRWISEITHFIQHNGTHSLVRNSASSLSFNTKERKSQVVNEKVTSWRKTVVSEADADDLVRPSTSPSDAGSSKSRAKSKRKEQTASPPKTSLPVRKQSSLEFTASKPSAARLAAISKPTPTGFRKPPPVVLDDDDDDAASSVASEGRIPMPSQPLTFNSSQIKHSTPKVQAKGRAPSPIEDPVPSSSPLSSPSRRPLTTASRSTVGAGTTFKRPRSPSPSTRTPSRPVKLPRTDDKQVLSQESPTLPRVIPSSSPLDPLPAALRTPGRKVPTLTELLAAKRAASGITTSNRRKNTLTIISTPMRSTGKAGPSKSASRVEPGDDNASSPVETPQPNKTNTRSNALGHLGFPKPSDPETGRDGILSNQKNPTRMSSAVLETQSSSSRMTSTSTIQHQPEFTASGYAIDLPLSVIDEFAGHVESDDERDQVKKNKKGKVAKGKGKEMKQRGYFGTDDVDLNSPTKLRPGVVRPFDDSTSESEHEEDKEIRAEKEKDEEVTPKRRRDPAFDESQLPDFTNDLSAFDPPQVSTQPRRTSGRGGTGSNYIGGFGAKPWENGGLDDDDEQDEKDAIHGGSSSDLGLGTPPSIFTKDGAINVRSLEKDPTIRSQAFFSIPGLNSPTKRGKDAATSEFAFGYDSQVDVDRDVDVVSRFMDKDVSLMDVDGEDNDG